MKNLLFFALFVNGVFGDEVKSVSVIEGDSVTLNSDLTGIQGDYLIVWTFGTNKTRIAQNNKMHNTSCVDVQCGGDDKRFRDRLKQDLHTASLTITNITTMHSGLYERLSKYYRTQDLFKSFNVIVYARLPVPVITTNSSHCSSSPSPSFSSCVLSCSVMNVSHVTLSWYKGNSLLSSISASDLIISLSLSLEVEYHHTNTYSCVINNPITNITQHLNITQHCQLCSGVIAAIVIFTVILCAVISGICFYCWRKTRRVKEKGEIDGITGSELQPLNGVRWAEENAVKKVEAVVGESVTLNTGKTKIKTDQVVWWFGEAVNTTSSFTVIARFNKQNNEEDYNSADKRFKDKLQLDHETGDLTITNITTQDSGLYKLHVGRNKAKLFIVNIYEEIKIVTVALGGSVTLPTDVTNLQRRDQILWKYEDALLAKRAGKCLTLHCNGNIKDRLCLNNHTGDLTIKNITSEDIGFYTLEIKSTKLSFKRFNVIVDGLSPLRFQTI